MSDVLPTNESIESGYQERVPFRISLEISTQERSKEFCFSCPIRSHKSDVSLGRGNKKCLVSGMSQEQCPAERIKKDWHHQQTCGL